jgi:hypothetical protein
MRKRQATVYGRAFTYQMLLFSDAINGLSIGFPVLELDFVKEYTIFDVEATALSTLGRYASGASLSEDACAVHHRS